MTDIERKALAKRLKYRADTYQWKNCNRREEALIEAICRAVALAVALALAVTAAAAVAVALAARGLEITNI